VEFLLKSLKFKSRTEFAAAPVKIATASEVAHCFFDEKAAAVKLPFSEIAIILFTNRGASSPNGMMGTRLIGSPVNGLFPVTMASSSTPFGGGLE
jgi:hypothetical protein